MTTTLQNATPDDLLAFLRSDSPLPKRAATNRAATPRAQLGNLPVERRPLTPIEAATLRRPPGAAERYRAATLTERRAAEWSDEKNHRDHSERLRRVECRLVAWLVCRALGPQWRFERASGDDYCDRCHRLVHRATTATLMFRICWRDDSRYEIVPENVHRSDALPSSITVSAGRSPADIARDIERRIVANGLFDQNALTLHNGDARRQTEIKRRREILAISAAYGGRMEQEQRWKSQGYPSGTTERFGRMEEDSTWRRQSHIWARSDYSGIELNIETTDVELAIKIAATVREFYQGGN